MCAVNDFVLFAGNINLSTAEALRSISQHASNLFIAQSATSFWEIENNNRPTNKQKQTKQQQQQQNNDKTTTKTQTKTARKKKKKN